MNRVFKTKYLLIITIPALIVAILSFLYFRYKGHQQEQQAVSKPFFFPMDGYIALPVDTKYSIPFTYCYDEETALLQQNDISKIQLKGVDAVSVRLLSVTSSAQEENGLQTCIFDIEFSFSELGLYNVTTFEIIDDDGNATEWPIGDWYFDIGNAPPEDYETIYSSVSLTATTSMYSYDFSLPENAGIKQICYGPNQCIASTGGLKPVGQINLDNSDAQVVVIRPRLEIDLDGASVWTYGSISYCGILGLSEVTDDGGAQGRF